MMLDEGEAPPSFRLEALSLSNWLTQRSAHTSSVAAAVVLALGNSHASLRSLDCPASRTLERVPDVTAFCNLDVFAPSAPHGGTTPRWRVSWALAAASRRSSSRAPTARTRPSCRACPSAQPPSRPPSRGSTCPPTWTSGTSSGSCTRFRRTRSSKRWVSCSSTTAAHRRALPSARCRVGRLCGTRTAGATGRRAGATSATGGLPSPTRARERAQSSSSRASRPFATSSWCATRSARGDEDVLCALCNGFVRVFGRDRDLCPAVFPLLSSASSRTACPRGPMNRKAHIDAPTPPQNVLPRPVLLARAGPPGRVLSLHLPEPLRNPPLDDAPRESPLAVEHVGAGAHEVRGCAVEEGFAAGGGARVGEGEGVEGVGRGGAGGGGRRGDGGRGREEREREGHPGGGGEGAGGGGREGRDGEALGRDLRLVR